MVVSGLPASVAIEGRFAKIPPSLLPQDCAIIFGDLIGEA
jgi:hypothetical protein